MVASYVAGIETQRQWEQLPIPGRERTSVREAEPQEIKPQLGSVLLHCKPRGRFDSGERRCLKSSHQLGRKISLQIMTTSKERIAFYGGKPHRIPKCERVR